MNRRYREARLLKKLKLTEAAHLLGVSQPTLSAWEGERKSPSVESLERMADLYGVTTDFLLGRDMSGELTATERISSDILPVLNGKPVWVKNKGWALVNTPDADFVFSDGSTMLFVEAMGATLMPEHYSFPELPDKKPIPFHELRHHTNVWIEPISSDETLKTMLRGRYEIKGTFAENTAGNRFSLDSYGATWIALKID